MKALVLGGSGFIGNHMADLLTEKGFEVTVFDRTQSPYLQENQKMVLGSINDLRALKEVVAGQDYVLNFAGIAGLPETKENAVAASEVNIIGNLKVLEANRDHPPKRYAFASTY